MNKDFLYVSAFCFDNMFDYLQKNYFRNSGHSIQNFINNFKRIKENLSNNNIIFLPSEN